MRKIKFYYFIAVVGAMALSLSSCTKDLEDDVDQLKKDMAENKSAISALEQAIKAGKLITDVKTVADGFEITFSDGSKIAVKNGANGANGAAGPAGSAGVAGVAGFAPIIGIDSENYWTVIKTQGGTAERILVDGKGVKAIGTANVQVIDGVLWIDGVTTTLGNLPSVVINEAQGTALISMWDGTAMKSFTVLMHNSNTIIRSISVPYSGAINVNIVSGKATKSFVEGPFGGKIIKDQVFKSSGALPIIVNPFNAEITKDMVTLVNKDEVALKINIAGVERGFSGAFTRTATPSNGLWSIKLEATSDTPTVADFIAVKVKLNNSESIYSTYDYNVVTTNATAVTLSAFTGSRAIGKDINFAARTTVIDNNKTGNLFNVDPTDIMLSNIQLHDDSKSFEKYIEFIKDGSGNITGVKTKDNAESHTALSGKDVKFIYTVVDYNGNSQNYAATSGKYAVNNATIATVKFVTLYDFDTFALANINYTISTSPATKDILADLTPLFNQLGETRLATWKANSTNLEVTIKDVDNTTVTGIVATVVDVDKAEVTAGDESPKFIKFVVTNGTVLPGEYTATMTYTDGRTGVPTFTTTVKITIANPANIADLLKVERVPAYFTGNDVFAYGTALSSANKVAQSALNDTKLDLTKLYNNVNTTGYVFEIAPAHALDASSIFRIAASDMYKTYKVTVYGIFAGNAANKIKVDEFNLMPKSEVKEGSITIKALEVTAGDDVTKVKISTSCTAKDVYGNDLKAFGIDKDVRAAKVDIVVDPKDPNRRLISTPTYDPANGWVITASEEVIVMDNTNVKLNVTITDLFGQKLESVITVTVKKKI